MTDNDIIAMVIPVAKRIAHLPVAGRITLLCALLAQEICSLPPTDRDAEFNRVLRDLPSIMTSTEDGMRQALVENARSGQ